MLCEYEVLSAIEDFLWITPLLDKLPILFTCKLAASWLPAFKLAHFRRAAVEIGRRAAIRAAAAPQLLSSDSEGNSSDPEVQTIASSSSPEQNE